MRFSYLTKTPIGFHGIETMLQEARQCSHWVANVLPFYALGSRPASTSHNKGTIPAHFSRADETPKSPAVLHIPLYMPPMSDNYLAKVAQGFAHLHDTYRRQFIEQIWLSYCSKIAVDHHLKAIYAQGANEGSKYNQNLFIAFNQIGLPVQAVFTQTTGTSDPALALNCQEFMTALRRWGHPLVQLIYLDNPHRDLPNFRLAYEVNSGTSICP